MARIKLEVVTPTGKVLDVMTESVTAPGVLGAFGVLPQHRPGLVMLGGGELTYEGGAGRLFIRGGVAEIRPDGVLVLADEARTVEQIDRPVAEEVLAASLKGFETHTYLDDEHVQALQNDRAYAEAMLKVGGH